MFESLSAKMAEITKTITGNARITENNIKDSLQAIRLSLLEADVSLAIVKQFIIDIKEEFIGQKVEAKLHPGQAIVAIVKTKLQQLLGDQHQKLQLNVTAPAIIMLAGLQGAGKTTTAAKLAKHIKETTKKKILLISTDIYRPAAREQLAVLAKQIGVDYHSDEATTVAAIASNGLKHATQYYYDVLIVDTAGRTAINADMMTELTLMRNNLQPHEVLFVADAMLGQTAAATAKAFHDQINITGVILTKADGDARGGAALSIRNITGQPIKFLGVSEKMNGLEPFYPDRLASRILGMGDVLSLIDDVRSKVDKAETAKMMQKLKKGNAFDFNDLRSQLQQMNKMGGMSTILDKLPANIAQKAPLYISDTLIKKNLAIIDSMTLQERLSPELLKVSRKKRLALGSGTTVQDINQLIKQYEEMKTVMKKIGNVGLAKLLRNFAGR